MKNVVEKRVTENITLLLESFEERFKERNITHELKLKKENENDLDSYTSEVEILFFKNNVFYDIIEFFIYRNGKLYVNEESLLKELYTDFEKTLYG